MSLQSLLLRRILGEDGGEEAEEGTMVGFEEEHEPEEAERLDNRMVTVIAVIVLLLILLTIGFEEGHHMILHASDQTTKPIVQAMFGELTVLGFLSLVTFCITQLGAFEKLSESIMSPKKEKEEENELLEVFEQVHYMLFLIMIVFVATILILVKAAKSMEREWYLMDLACRSPEYMMKAIRFRGVEATAELDEDRTNNNNDVKMSWMSFFCHHHFWIFRLCTKQGRSTSSLQINDEEFRRKLLTFYSIREEFKLNRSMKPPFLPTVGIDGSSNTLPDDFHFGRYLR
jgi:hypothetical protein